MIHLTGLPLTVSKNALHIPIRCGRFTKMVRSKKARLREQEIVACIWRQIGRPLQPCFDGPVSISWTMVAPDSRKRDVANYGEQLLDCLQAAGIVKDDAQVVHETHELMPYARKPGHIDITIEAIP